ncbi:MAG: NAD-dependent epimerase/dehydratase family protein [Bdellovibrionota bacterium]
MKIFITGIAGFIGSNLAEKLNALGADVVGVDSFEDYYNPKFKRHTAKILEKQGIKVYELNLCSDDLSKALEDSKVIYHIAAQPGNDAKTPFDNYVKNNIYATYNLLNQVKNLKTLKSFINIATSSVYGFYATSSESETPLPVSPYGITKLAAEHLVMSERRNNGFPACSCRLFSVFGKRERPDKLYPKLIKALDNDTKFPLFDGSLEHTRSFTNIEDIVDGLILVLNKWDKAEGEIFNLGTDEQSTTKEGIEIAEKLFNKKLKIDLLPKRLGDQIATHANIKKINDILGYTPKVSLKEGLENMIHWYLSEVKGIVEY